MTLAEPDSFGGSRIAGPMVNRCGSLMSMTSHLMPTTETSLPSLPKGWMPLKFRVLLDGRLAVLADDQDLIARIQAGPSVWAEPYFQERCSRAKASIWILDDSRWQLQILVALETPFTVFDQFPDGRWLVVGTRTLGGDNARILTSNGKLLRRITLGDGIADVQTDTSCRLWVSWFDEGVFGNREWVIPGREWPPSSSVIACFDDTGRVIWEPTYAELEEIPADCYALNVDRDAWAWTDFGPRSLHLFRPGLPEQHWAADTGSIEAIAVAGNELYLAGGFEPNDCRIVRVTLKTNGTTHVTAQMQLDLPQRRDRIFSLLGRGGVIHHVMVGVWRQWSLT
jgi:hypothetical protein